MHQDRITMHFTQAQMPKQLLSTGRAPKELFTISGSEEAFPFGHYIAMVGTRRSSGSAETLCKRLVHSLAGSNAVIVSGLAQGIDSFCHKAALEAGLKTIAVLAQGLESRITGERGVLAKDILNAGGTLVTEYPGDMASHKGMFPARNRIIAGLSKEIVVVESGLKGGSLITADFAMEFHRKILAVPGNFDSEHAQGPLDLLRKGIAKPIYMPEDLPGLCGICKKSQETAGNKRTLGLSREARELFEKFAGYTKTLSELNAQKGITANGLFAILTELELAGLTHTLDGFRYIFDKD